MTKGSPFPQTKDHLNCRLNIGNAGTSLIDMSVLCIHSNEWGDSFIPMQSSYVLKYVCIKWK